MEAGSATTDTSTGVFEVHSALSTTNASRYVAGTDFPITDVDVQNRFLPSEKSQYERDFEGIPSALNDTGQLVEKQTYRYFPDGRRSTPKDGTTESPSGGGTVSREYAGDPVPDSDFWDFTEAVLDVFAVFETAVGESAPVFVTEVTGIANADVCEVGKDGAVDWESPAGSLSRKPGKYETRSVEYPENEVVSVSGTVGNQDEAVRSEEAETLLIRNSEAVEASVRKADFWSVVPLNHRRRTDQETDAVEKYPVAVATLSA